MYKVNGPKIKERRKELNLSQEALANKIGVSKVMICWYESGERTPSMEKFLKLADVLNLSLDELSGRQVSVVSSTDEKYEVKMAKEDLEIISEIKKYHKLYEKLFKDPVRTVKLIDKRMK